MSPIDLNRNLATDFIGRGIPDRSGVTDPSAKRVLDALAETVQQMGKRMNEISKALNTAEGAVAAKAATAGSGVEEPSAGTPSSPGQVLEGQHSVAVVGNKIQFVNDKEPGNLYVYATDAEGNRGWMTAVDFVNVVLGDALETYLEAWMTTWVAANTVEELMTSTSSYSEGTKQFVNILRRYRVFGVEGVVPSVIFTAEECP